MVALSVLQVAMDGLRIVADASAPGRHCWYPLVEQHLHIVMAYIVMAYIVMAFMVMACIVMAYVVMAASHRAAPLYIYGLSSHGMVL